MLNKNNLIKEIIKNKIAEDNCKISPLSLNNLKCDLLAVFEKYAEVSEGNFLLKAKILHSGNLIFEVKCGCKNFFF